MSALASPQEAPEPEKPKPWLLIGLAIGVPVTLALLAWGAQYQSYAVWTAGLLPFICIVAYLMTPLAPDADDPNEPPLPTLEDYIPAPLMVIVNAITAVIDAIYTAVFDALMAVVGPALAPHVMVIAQLLQLSMGIMAVREMANKREAACAHACITISADLALVSRSPRPSPV